MTGTFLKIDEAEYHRDRGRLSGSVLRLVQRDPRLFKAWLDGSPGPKPTREMNIGSYVHALVLEGLEVANRKLAIPPSQHDAYRALSDAEKRRAAKGEDVPRKQQDPSPNGAFRTMQRKGVENEKLWRDFEQSAEGRIIVRHEDIPMAHAMRRAVMACDEARELLEAPGFEPEVSAHWDCPETGEPMRCRFDGIPGYGQLTSDVVTELKCVAEGSLTNRGLDQKILHRYVQDQGWAVKGALYHDGFEAIQGTGCSQAWIIVEMSMTPRCWVAWLEKDAPMVEMGRYGCRRYEIPGYISLVKQARRIRETGDTRLDCERWRHGVLRLPEYLEAAVEDERQWR